MTTIYMLIDPITNECRYIGKSKNPNERFARHIWEAKQPGRKRKVYSWIKSLLNKNTKPEMIVLDVVEDWVFWEEFYVSYYISIGCNLTNLADGGKGSTGYKPTQEWKDKVSKKLKGRKPWNTGKSLTDEHKRKIGRSYPLSEEQKAKIGNSNRQAHQSKSKLDEDDVRSIKSSNKSRRELAEEYGVSYACITDVILGRRWKNIN